MDGILSGKFMTSTKRASTDKEQRRKHVRIQEKRTHGRAPHAPHGYRGRETHGAGAHRGRPSARSPVLAGCRTHPPSPRRGSLSTVCPAVGRPRHRRCRDGAMRRVTTKYRHGAVPRSGHASQSDGVSGSPGGHGGGGRRGVSDSDGAWRCTAARWGAPTRAWEAPGSALPPGGVLDAEDVALEVLRDDGRVYGGGDGDGGDGPVSKRWDAALACAPWVVVEDVALVGPPRTATKSSTASGGGGGGGSGGGDGGGGGSGGVAVAEKGAEWEVLGRLMLGVPVVEEERWLYGEQTLPPPQLQALETWLSSANVPFSTLQRVSAYLLTSSTAPAPAIDERIRVLAEATTARACLEADGDSGAAVGPEPKKKKKGFKGFSLPGKKAKSSSSLASAKASGSGGTGGGGHLPTGRARVNWEAASSAGAAVRHRAAGGAAAPKLTTPELLAEKRSVEETLARFDAQLAALAAGGGDEDGDMAAMLLPARQELDERLRGLTARLVAGGTVTDVAGAGRGPEATARPQSADIIDGSASTMPMCVEVIRTSPHVSSPVSVADDSDGSERASVDTSVSADAADCAQALRACSYPFFEDRFSPRSVADGSTTTYVSDVDSVGGSSYGSSSDGGPDSELSTLHQRRLASRVSRSSSGLRAATSDLEFIIDLGERGGGDGPRACSPLARHRPQRSRQWTAELCVDDGDMSSDLESEQALSQRRRRHIR